MSWLWTGRACLCAASSRVRELEGRKEVREGGRKERKGRRKEGTFYTKAGISAGGGTAPPPPPSSLSSSYPKATFTDHRAKATDRKPCPGPAPPHDTQ